MTPETKVGLLVGLGAIVVFAVVLSHTGTVPQPGDTPLLVNNQPDASPTATSTQPTIESERSGRTDSTAAGTTERTQGRFAPSNRRPRGLQEAPAHSPIMPTNDQTLPYVPDLEVAMNNVQTIDPNTIGPETTGSATPTTSPATSDARVNLTNEFLPTGHDATATTAETIRSIQLHGTPILPEPIVPAPTVRDETPETTPVPPDGTETPETPAAPEQIVPTSKTYVVMKGETIGTICSKHYGTSRPKVIEYLVKKNKTIHNANTIREGQEILIPNLPADMFEAVQTTPGAQLVIDLENAPAKQTPNTNERHAPTLDIPGTSSISSGYREYVVQPKDTLYSISRTQLGSIKYWKDIQKLNDVSPKKIRPGMKLKIPHEPVSRSDVNNQVSA